MEGRHGSAGAPRTLAGGVRGGRSPLRLNRLGGHVGPPMYSAQRMQVGPAARARREAARLGIGARGEERHQREAARAHRAARRQAVFGLALTERVHRLTRDAEVATRGTQLHALDAEQPLLETELVARIARESPRSADHAMARHDDGQRIPAQRLRHRAHGARPADTPGHTPVRGHGAVRDGRRRLQHGAGEVARGEPPVERPVEIAPAARDVVEQLPLQALELRPALDGLHALVAGEPRGAQRGGGAEVLHHRDAVLRAADEDVTERRREDAIRHAALPEIREPALQPGARLRHRLRRRDRAQPARDLIDGAVPAEFLAARRAAVEMAVDALRGAGLRVPRRRGDEIDFDRAAGRVLGSHRTLSIIGSSWPLRPSRIFFSAWNTWARALSGEHSRLRPIASYSRSCSLRSTNASRCLSGSPSTRRTPSTRVSRKRRSSSGLAGSTSVRTSLTPAYARRRRLSERDRKSTRLNSSHGYISYAVFCLKKKKTKQKTHKHEAKILRN